MASHSSIPQSLEGQNRLINGRYLLHEKLGEGGMGVVYRATDRLTQETVALKRVNTSYAENNESFRLALAQEFQILAGLRHPHIISVLDYGFDGEKRPFFTMTYLPERQTILDAAQGASFEQKIELIQQLLQALAYLHRRGVLHRDIKPENVVVVDGIVRILDFGLSSNKQSAVNFAFGSPLYMAPEQITDGLLTSAADLYAVGVLMYQLLTGEHPSAPLDFQILDRVINTEPSWEGVEPRIRPFLSQLLAKNPQDRPKLANDALLLLANALGESMPEESAIIRDSYIQAANFVGRVAERKQLAQALRQAKQGKSSTWLVGGESGVGKSRLLEEISIQAMIEGWQVLRGQEVQGDGLPYQLWREIVPRLMLNAELTDLETAVMKELAPDIDRLLGRSIHSLTVTGAESQELLHHTFVKILKQQTQPTLLLLEDLHWTETSLSLLSHLFKSLPQLPNLIILGTYRRDERPELPTELPQAQVMLLDRLAEAEVAQLTQAILGVQDNTAELVALLTKETEGNTFFIVEVMRALAEEARHLSEIHQMALPKSILTSGMESLLQWRIRKVLKQDQPLLQAAAVAGRKLDLAIMEVLASKRVLAGWLQRVSETMILTVKDNLWRFSHDKLRETILAWLSPDSLIHLHRQVAEAIEQVYPENRRYHQALLEHWHRVGDIDKEIYYLDSVAEYLIEQKADYRRGKMLLERGLRLVAEDDPRRVSLLNWLAKACFELRGEKNVACALTLSGQAYDLAKKIGDQHGQIKSLDRAAMSLMMLDDANVEAEQYFRQALDIAQTIDDAYTIARVLFHLGVMSYRQGKLDEAMAFYHRAIPVQRLLDDQNGLARTLDHLGQIYLATGDYEQAHFVLQQSLAIYRSLGLEHFCAWSLLNLGRVPIALGDYERAEHIFQESLAIFEKYGILEGKSYCVLNLGRIAVSREEFEQAERHFTDGLRLSKAIDNRRCMAQALRLLGWLAFRQEQYAQAEQQLQHGLALFQALGDKRYEAEVLEYLGIVYLVQGNAAHAQSFFYDSLMIAQDIQLEPVQIDIVLGFAWLTAIKDKTIRAAELIGLATEHPSFNDEMLVWLEMVQKQVKKWLSDSDFARGLAEGKSLSLENIVAELLETRLEGAVKLHNGSKKKRVINGRYLLHEKLGEGGMGVVYRATDRLTQETVALKQVNTLFTENNEAFRLALAQEFQILAGLRHPHIISVLDYGFDGEKRPFFTMTYLPKRQTILEAAEGKSFDGKIELIQQLLQALAYLHRREVLHRDIKPDNVLVIAGKVQVLDFGLSANEQSNPNASMGTPLYMAPELFDDAEYSKKADLYSVGILLYQLLIGKHPFTPFDHKFLDRVLDGKPDFSPVAEQIRPLLAMLLARQPEDRFENAQAVIVYLAKLFGKIDAEERAAIRESFLQAARFVGREPELKQLLNALNGAKAGGSAVWLLGGESGVGKTRLLDELQTHALVTGWQVLTGQAVSEGGFLYHLWRDIVPHLALVTTLSDFETAVLQEIYPQLDQLLERQIPPLTPLNGAAGQQRLIVTLTAVLQRQTQPTLLLLEDLQWARESLSPLTHLLKILEHLPNLLIVGSYRSDEQPLLPQKLPGAHQLLLSRLSEQQVAELSTAILGHKGNAPEIVSLINKETEGNTFFVVEVMRTLAEEAGQLDNILSLTLPKQVSTAGIQQLMRRRIERIEASDLALLQIAAVAGRQLDLRLIGALAQDQNVSSWLQRLSEAAVLHVRHNQWQFAHDKLRETVIHELEPHKRQSIHRDIAATIEQLYPENESYIELLHQHWQLGGDIDKEISYLIPVTRQLIDITADYQHADDLLTKGRQKLAGDDPRQVTLLNWSARSQLFQSNYDAVEAEAQEALRLGKLTNSQEEMAISYNSLALVGFYTSRHHDALEYHQKALEIRRALGLEKDVAQSLNNMSLSLTRLGRFEEAESIQQQSLAINQAINSPNGLANNLNNLGLIAYELGDFPKAQAYFEQSTALWEQAGHQRGLAGGYNNLGLVNQLQKRYEQAIKYLNQSLEIVRSNGGAIGIASSLNNLGEIYFRLAQPEQAEQLLNEALEIAQTAGSKHIESGVLTNLGGVALDKGNLSQARAHHQRALAIRRKSEELSGLADSLVALGVLDILEGEIETAKTHLQESLAIREQLGEQKSIAHSLGCLGFAHLPDDTHEAARLLLKALTIARDQAATSLILELFVGLSDLLWSQPSERSFATELIQFVQQHPDKANEVGVWLRHKPHLKQVAQSTDWSRSKQETSALDEFVDKLLAHPRLKGERQQIVVNGRYLLHETLGHGSMGEVYRATDRLTQEIVALKRVFLPHSTQGGADFSPELNLETLRLNLAQEFQLLAGLRHPHIISVLDYGFDEGKRPFYTMAYLTNSQNILAATKDASFERKVDLIQQLLKALAYLHRRGIWHRDLKPDNVLVADGAVRILDFGLSEYKQGSDNGALAGTPLYMAPELFDGAGYSESADLYAVGIIFYQLLCGHHPFAPFDDQFIDRLQNEAPNLTQVEVRLRPFFAQLLAKTPTKRFVKASEVLKALALALNQPMRPETAAIRESYLQAAKFVGRQRELGQLTRAFTEAKEGGGSAWLIGGESGVGKSRLIDEVRIRALTQGVLVLRGQQPPTNSGLLLQLWKEPIRRLLLQSDVDDLSVAVLKDIVPNIGSLLNREVLDLPHLDNKASQQRLFSTILRLFRQHDGPMLLILEDLHWANVSLELLKLFTQIVSQLPLVIIGSYRDDEAPTLKNVLPQMNHIELSRLPDQTIAELSESILGEVGQQPHILSWLQAETEGNAFFLVELIRALAEETGRLNSIGDLALPKALLPDGIDNIVQRRLAQVPHSAQALLQLAAMAGRELDLTLLASLAKDQVDIENEWLIQCSEAAVISIEDDAWQFAHNKIREGILATLEHAQVKIGHQKIAAALIDLYGDSPARAATLSSHYAQAGNNEKAQHFASIAGSYALEQYALAEAIAHFSHAFVRTPETEYQTRFDLIIQRFDVHYLSSNPHKQEEDIVILAELAQKLGARAEIDLNLKRAKLARATGRTEASGKHAQAAIELSQSIGDVRREAEGYFSLGGNYYKQGNPNKAEEELLKSLALGQRVGDSELCLKVTGWLASTAFMSGDLDKTEAYHKQLLSNENLPIISILNNTMMRGHVHLYRQQPDKAIPFYEEGIKLSRQVGSVIYEGKMLGSLANVYHQFLADFELARQHYEADIALQWETGDLQEIALVRFNLGSLFVETGLWDESEQQLTQVLQMNESLQEIRLEASSYHELGVLWHLRQKEDKAQAYLEKALETIRPVQISGIERVILVDLALFYLDTGQLSLAQNAVEAAALLSGDFSSESTLLLKIVEANLLISKNEQSLAKQIAIEVAEALNVESDEQGHYNPIQVSFYLIRLCERLNISHFTEHILDSSYTDIQAMAERISDPIWRQAFLENVPENREIIQRYNGRAGNTAVSQSTAPAKQAEDELIEAMFATEGQQADTPIEKLHGEALLTHLLTVSRRMSTMRSVRPLLSYVMNEVLQLVGAEQGFIVLLRKDGTLDYRVRRRADGTDIIQAGDMISHSILDEVVKTKQPLVVKNALFDPRFGGAQSVMAMKLRSVMCAPLMTHSKLIGAIYVENRAESGRFDQEDIAPLEFFSNQAAVAIESAHLNENLEELIAERTWQLAEAKEVAENANQAKTKFLSNMSHELRTPLNAILNFTGFVADGFYGEINDEQQVALQQVLDSGDHLLSLINDILDLNKIESGMMQLMLVNVDIGNILHQVTQTARSLIKGKPIKINLKINDKLPIIQGDKRKLRQIFLNLASNAVKYTKGGTITISAKETKDHIQISFKDTGIGINPEDRHLIFEAYGQAKRNPENVVSTGLGLPITKDLVELHDGNIWFESEINKGSTFFVNLPIKQEKR